MHSAFVAKFNHSCSPNAEVVYNDDTGTRDLVATADIVRGEEIVHNYLHRVYDYKDRITEIEKRWCFKCGCEACSNKIDFTTMKEASRMEHQIKTKSYTVKLSQVENILEDLKLDSQNGRFRVSKVLNFLELLYNNVCETSWYDQHALNVSREIATLAIALSCTLFGNTHSHSMVWYHREKYSVLNFAKVKVTLAIKKVLIFLTYVIILLNFFENNVTPFNLLLLTFSLFWKT